MAGPPSNFDGEIKKAMKPQSVATAKTPDKEQPASAKSSTNATPAAKPSATMNKNNEWNQSSGPVSSPGNAGVNGDTHARMLAAGQAHMQAIHDHISAVSSGGGAGGLTGNNKGTVA